MIETNALPTDEIARIDDTVLPPALQAMLAGLDEFKDQRRRIAVFDLDNTLLVGDIGDAVFAKLTMQGYMTRFRWEEYMRLSASNRREAYSRIVTSMAGLSERLVQKTTLDILGCSDRYLEMDRATVPVPYPHPMMRRLVSTLKSKEYRIVVISASNEISARIAAWKLFGIAPYNVFGIRQLIRDGILTDHLLEPVPFGEGKVRVYRKFVGERNPVIAAGDSPFDLPMLSLVGAEGLVLWVGEEKADSIDARQEFRTPSNFYVVPRPTTSEVNEKGSDDCCTQDEG
ncbi:MAG TPA: HAD-IB family phosphatase [Bacteroidota bacterium]|nr:HAD-IB family phosphatase [Bacteroidota bacterium]